MALKSANERLKKSATPQELIELSYMVCVKLMVELVKIRVHNLGVEIHTLFAHFAKTSIHRVIIIAFSIPNRVNRMNVFIFVYWNVISFNIAVLRNEEIHVIVQTIPKSFQRRLQFSFQ